MSLHVSRERSLVKTLTWRIIASTDTFLIAYFFTESAAIGASIAGVEVITKMILYYFHERGWNTISWGKDEDGVAAV